MTFQRVKGTEDFHPKEYALRKEIFRLWEEEAKRFGFQQIDVPVIETIKLLTAKSGESVKEEIFVLEKRSTEELGLRFDLTVPMTRMFVAKQRELAKPVKWFAVDKNWRYEAPQKGRQREFVQLSVELFGSDKPEADATCINLAIACFERLGLKSNDITLRINNRKLLEGILTEIIPKNKIADAIQVIDKSRKITDAEFFDLLKQKGITAKQAEEIKEILAYKGAPAILEKLKKELKLNELARQGLKELEGTIAFVTQEYVTVDLSIARGLAYYTGNVYEFFDREGKYRSLAAGGRYDELVGLFGGEQTPATGFAMGIETVILLLTEKNLLPAVQTGPDYYVAPVDEKMLPKAMEIADSLRAMYKADMDLMRRKLGKQLEYASAIGAKKVIIVGEKDLKEGKVTVKDLASGKEEKVEIKKLTTK